MLKLKRKAGEKIVISHETLPGDIVIEHLAAGRSAVYVGITAPDSVRIMRAELLERQPKPPRKAA